MKKTSGIIIWILGTYMVLILTACTTTSILPTISPSPTTTPTPANEYTNSDDFGDGYISRISIKDLNNLTPEEIVQELVINWLDHYKNQSEAPSDALIDYTLDEINILNDSSNSGFEMVAGVKFSIIPTQIPNDWASFPGNAISQNDVWWHLSAPFGILKEGDFFILKLVFGWGT